MLAAGTVVLVLCSALVPLKASSALMLAPPAPPPPAPSMDAMGLTVSLLGHEVGPKSGDCAPNPGRTSPPAAVLSPSVPSPAPGLRQRGEATSSGLRQRPLPPLPLPLLLPSPPSSLTI